MEKARWLALGIAMTFLASGCAQWTAMTRQDKIIVSTIGCAAAGAGIGAAAGSGGHASGREYLTKRGVDASRITTRGFGLTKPIADNKTAEGRAKNRRVEIKVR